MHDVADDDVVDHRVGFAIGRVLAIPIATLIGLEPNRFALVLRMGPALSATRPASSSQQTTEAQSIVVMWSIRADSEWVTDGTLHVDKNGVTCAAGAGSIALPNLHGFLHNGHLAG